MRILLVNGDFTMSGASLMLLWLAEHLKSSGHELAVMAINREHGPIKDDYLKRGIAVDERMAPGDADVAICNSIAAAEMVTRIAPHAKTIWWIHEAETGLALLLQNPSWIRAFHDASLVVFQHAAQRDAVYRSFIYGLDPHKFRLIPNGISFDPSSIVPQKPGRMRVVAIGTVAPRKRQGDIIRAVHALKNTEVECVIIGKVLYLSDHDKAIVARSPERFRLLGELPNDEARSWLKSADVFCQCSETESQPIALLEAACLGLPLIVSNLWAYHGVWRHGINCLAHPIGDVELLAYLIEILTSNPRMRERLGQAAKKTAENFRQDMLFSQFDLLLRELS